MIEKIVKEELNTRVWTFIEIADVSTTVELLTQIVYDKIPTKDKLEIVWDVEVFAEEKVYFGELYSKTIMSELRVMVADIVKDELSLAKIVFNKNEVDKNEVSKRSVGGQSSKGRTTDEKNDSKE
tara:strand:- start:4970 stop:5344 length:375 start_codon:yes stop_codon:yes gene_type:complete